MACLVVIGAIVLAAGHGSRFGTNKLLQKNAAGLALASLSARALQGIACKVAVVSKQARPLEVLYQNAGFQIVQVPSEAEAPCAPSGMSLSLRCGVAACVQAHGWIIALADMPGVSAHTVRQIATALEMGAPLVACRYRGQRGNPVGFSQAFGPALMNLSGDQGARALLQLHSNSIHWLDVDDPGILFDVDTPADWQRWLALEASASIR